MKCYIFILNVQAIGTEYKNVGKATTRELGRARRKVRGTDGPKADGEDCSRAAGEITAAELRRGKKPKAASSTGATQREG
jgi:hypothetical protein